MCHTSFFYILLVYFYHRQGGLKFSPAVGI
nr:MAG TPA: hypothetical protein [Caudoviricetes sp.]